MKAIILAGGLGQRLRSAIGEMPKPMAPVAGKPFLEYLVLQLLGWNIRDIIIATGYKANIIQDYFGDGHPWGARICYSHERRPLGTGGAIKYAAKMICDESFLVLNGDSFLDFNFFELRSFHTQYSAIATIGLTRMEDTERYGHVDISRKGQIEQFSEKTKANSGFINGGVYLCSSDLVDSIPVGKVSLESDIMPLLIGKGLFGMFAGRVFADIGTPDSYQRVCENTQEIYQIAGLRPDGRSISDGRTHISKEL